MPETNGSHGMVDEDNLFLTCLIGLLILFAYLAYRGRKNTKKGSADSPVASVSDLTATDEITPLTDAATAQHAQATEEPRTKAEPPRGWVFIRARRKTPFRTLNSFVRRFCELDTVNRALIVHDFDSRLPKSFKLEGLSLIATKTTEHKAKRYPFAGSKHQFFDSLMVDGSSLLLIHMDDVRTNAAKRVHKVSLLVPLHVADRIWLPWLRAACAGGEWPLFVVDAPAPRPKRGSMGWRDEDIEADIQTSARTSIDLDPVQDPVQTETGSGASSRVGSSRPSISIDGDTPRFGRRGSVFPDLETLYPGTGEFQLDLAQIDGIRRMRELVSAEGITTSRHPEISGDLRHLRFLEGYNMDVHAATEAYVKMIRWREKFGTDKIRERIALHWRGNYNECAVSAVVPGWEEFRAAYPHNPHFAEDKLGNVLALERLGYLDPVALHTKISEEDTVLYRIHNAEYKTMLCDLRSRASGRLIAVSLIYDLENVGTKHLYKPGIDRMRNLLAVEQPNYPESVHKIWIVNAPWIFGLACKLLTPWIAPRTLNRISIFTTSEAEKAAQVLREEIDVDVLPKKYGGNRDDSCLPTGGLLPG